MDDGGSRIATSDEIDLGEVFNLVLDEWRWFVAIIAAATLAAAAYAFLATPVFRTNALVQVEEKESGFGGIPDFSAMLTGETRTAAELEIVSSRLVLGAAVEAEKLAIQVEPKRFPLIGDAVARRYDGDGVAEAWLGLESYAWGGERLRVERLDVDRFWEGEELLLKAGEDGEFTLFGPSGEELLAGRVGTAADGNGVSLFVSELVARPGTEFRVKRADPFETLTELRERLVVVERGRQTGILELSLEGRDPEKIATVLDSIAEIYLRQNVERRSEEAAQTLRFLHDQLPELNAQLQTAEEALNQFRVEKGSIDLNLEAQGLLEQLTDVEKQLSELDLLRAERAQRFTSQHPTMVALQEQQRELLQTRAKLEAQIRELPESEQDALRLMRDVGVANELYTLLLNRAQELKVVQAGTIGNVRIIDTAFVPRKPVKPRKAMIIGLGVGLGAALGVLAIFLRQLLSSGIRDPKMLEQDFGLPVYAIVPRSESEAEAERKGAEHEKLIALRDAHDPAVEALRSLRTSVEFLFHDASNRVLAIGGPAPAVGKSFVSANISALMAQVGRRVLIVDADLRRGRLHRSFGLERSPGLSELVAGERGIDECVRFSGVEGLHVLTTGTLPPNPAELLASRRFDELLQELSSRFDTIVLDAPPVLAAPEAAQLAKLAGISLIVVRSGRQHRREVELTIDRLAQAGAPPRGFVFNDISVTSRRYAYAGYRYYRYEKES